MVDYQYDYVILPNFTANGTSNGTFYDCYHIDFMDPACDIFYEEKPFKLTTGKVLSAIGIAILIVAALVGNVLVCVAFCHYKRLRTVPNYFIMSLAVSDIMVAAFSMPLWLSIEVSGWEQLPDWIDYLTLANYWEVIDILAAVSSIANLAAISLDRLFSIMAPLRHRTRMTPVVALIMITIAWLYALTIALCKLVNFADFTALSASLGFFLPLLVIVSSYLAIYIKFRIRSMRQSNFEGDWNLEKTLLIVIGLFVVCWLPFFVTSLMYHYCIDCPFNDVIIQHLRGFTKWMHYLNSCCNPIVYGFCNINFKTAFWALLSSCFGRQYSDMDLGPCSRETSNSQAGTILRHLKSIKRKLSWKRDVEESVVSNGGEVNDNSISLAILALQLKGGESAGAQEAQSLLDASDSRPSSKASEDIGLISDEPNSVPGWSGDEGSAGRCKQKGYPCEGAVDSGARIPRSREFTNRSYSSLHGRNESKECCDVQIEHTNRTDATEERREVSTPVPSNGDGNVRSNFINTIFAQFNGKDKQGTLDPTGFCEPKDSGVESTATLVPPELERGASSDIDSLTVNESSVWRRRSGLGNVSIADIIEGIAIQIEAERNEGLIRGEQIIDTKESIV